MEKTKVTQIIAMVRDDIPKDQILLFKQALEAADESAYDVIITTPLKSKTTCLLLSIFFGEFGVDRFYIGDTGLGIAKLLLGWFTLGIWPLIDIFLSYKKCAAKNLETLMQLL